ncbi:MAG TPA: outer membrane lipoprotein LolB [Burkholderiales bacterium]|nr:outer membrane lipoprotein LolB [Burkholderiales bacterium]
MKRGGLAAAAAVLILVAGCAQVEILPPQGPLDFDLNGRIAARYGAESFTGNVSWRHARDGDEMLISTPFGQGVARIVRQGEAVLLTTADGKEHRANDAEDLTERVLGFRVPIVGLADWVQGRPSPELEARGWKIEYQERDEQRRPTRLRLTYQGIELRLAVMQWR